MRNTTFILLLGLLLSGCSQKPVPWVKTNAQKAYDMLGFEKDRGSSITIPSYYQGSNRQLSKQAGEVRYLQEIYPNESFARDNK